MNDMIQEKENTKKRIRWIDIARGIGIFLIVMAHVKNKGPVREMITYSVPFFFFLTGLTFHKKENQKEFIKSKIKSLYIPYIVVSLISIFIYLLLGQYIGENVGFHIKDISNNLFGMIYANAALGNMMWNRPLWFIPVYLVSIIITNFIEKIKNVHIKNIVIVLATALGMTLAYFNINLPLQLETALSMIIWIYLGIYLKMIFMKMENKKKLLVFIFIVTTILGLIMGRINGAISIIVDKYGKNVIFYFIATILWIVSLITLSIIIKENKKIEFVGKNTLIILLLHKFPILFFQKICPIVKDLLNNSNYIIEIITSIFVSVIVVILCLIFDKYFKEFINNIKNRYVKEKN